MREDAAACIQADAVAMEATSKLPLPAGFVRAAEEGHRLATMLLRRYVATYKRCLQCRGYNTGLVSVDGVIKVRCARCRTDNVVKV
jgi:hypothetical protein